MLACGPQRVAAPPGVRFRAVSAGDASTCAVAVSDEVYCWGTRVVSVEGTLGTSVDPTPWRVVDR